MLKVLLSGIISFAILDGIWLGWLGKNIYKDELRSLGRFVNGNLELMWGAVFLVYALLLGGLYYFVLPQVSGLTSMWKVFIIGGAFGLITYGIYDFTNLAVLKNWTLKVTVVDVIWGIMLCGITTVVMWWVSK